MMISKHVNSRGVFGVRVHAKRGGVYGEEVRMGNHDMDALVDSAKAADFSGANLIHVSRGA